MHILYVSSQGPRVFSSNHGVHASAHGLQFHWGSGGDSGTIVTPFMRVGNEPTRNFATFKPLELQLPFTWASMQRSPWDSQGSRILFTCKHRAGVRPYTSFIEFAKSCVFEKQSPSPGFCHHKGLSSTEGTRVFCRVPSPEFALSLSLLNLSTCGGFEYGSYKRGLPAHTPETPSIDNFNGGLGICDTHSWIPIDVHVHLHLRDRLILRCFPVQRNPVTFGFFDSYEDTRYSYQHSHSCVLQVGYQPPFSGKQDGLLLVHISLLR